MSEMRQVTIRKGQVHQTTWIEDHPKLKKGVYITLKGEGDDRWEVLSISNGSVDKQTLYKPWHVGGL